MMVKNGSSLDKLICTKCGKGYLATEIKRMCDCGKVLFPVYNLEKAKETLSKNTMNKRRYNIWRMTEIMPVKDPTFYYSLGEGWTPILHLKNLGE
ncbi:MAG: threonine synthase, partial [Promethearchaeota archaeon]